MLGRPNVVDDADDAASTSERRSHGLVTFAVRRFRNLEGAINSLLHGGQSSLSSHSKPPWSGILQRITATSASSMGFIIARVPGSSSVAAAMC